MAVKQQVNREKNSLPVKETKRKPFPVNTKVIGFQDALRRLNSKLNELPDDPQNMTLFHAGLRVYNLIKELEVKKKTTVPESQLTTILVETAIVVAGNKEHPEGDVGYTQALIKYHRLSNKVRRFPFGKILASAMLTLMGTAIIAASGIIAAVSFGLLAPLSIFGMTLGASMLVGGIASGGAVIGAAAVMGGGMMFFKATKSSGIHEAMQEVEISARERYGFRN